MKITKNEQSPICGIKRKVPRPAPVAGKKGKEKQDDLEEDNLVNFAPGPFIKMNNFLERDDTEGQTGVNSRSQND